MDFPDELWRNILTYLGPNKSSIELACRRTGITVSSCEPLEQQSTLYLEIATTSDFVHKIQNRCVFSPVRITILDVKRNEDKGVFDVYFVAIYNLRITWGMGGTRYAN